jgi:uncharacterized delta-60 repeat protein
MTHRRPRLAPSVAFALVGVVLLAGTALAAGGQLDRTFSGDGKAVTKLQPPGAASDVGLSGSKTVLAGGNGFGVVLIRYTADGSLDHTFGGDGKVRANFLGNPNDRDAEVASALAVQADGKVVVVGGANAGTQGEHGFVARFNADGALDKGFASQGSETTSFFVNDVSIHPKCFVRKGTSCPNPGTEPGIIVVAGGDRVVSYERNGMRQTAFGSGGQITTSFKATSVKVNFGDNVFVGGYVGTKLAVQGFNKSGGAYTRFNAGKPAVGGLAGLDCTCVHIGVQGDGSVVATSKVRHKLAIIRYYPYGMPDSTFSGDGKLLTHWGDDALPTEIVVQPNDQKLVLAVRLKKGGKERFAVARYTDIGKLDSTFSGDGQLVLSFGGDGSGRANGVAVNEMNRKITVVGTALGGFAAARLLGR